MLMSRTYGHRSNKRTYWTTIHESVKHFSNEKCRAEARLVRDNARHGRVDEGLPIDYVKHRYQDIWAWD